MGNKANVSTVDGMQLLVPTVAVCSGILRICVRIVGDIGVALVLRWNN
jgi:hypothetical protein